MSSSVEERPRIIERVEMSKVVQGFRQSPDYLDDSLRSLFLHLNGVFQSLSTPIQNIVFRKINNRVSIVLHIPDYDLDQGYLVLYGFPWDDYQVKTLQVHPHAQYRRGLDRIILFGSEISSFTLPSSKQSIYYSPDSFLQPSLVECDKMYITIHRIIQHYTESNSKAHSNLIAGFGDDTLNIAHYLDSPMFSYMHCRDTLIAGCDDRRQGTTNLDDWCNRLETIRDSVGLLIITPGRKGLKYEEMAIICRLQIPLVIYLACKPEVLSRDLNRVNEIQPNSYKLRESHQFNMYEGKSVPTSFSQTVQVWSKVAIFSLGEDCCIQYHLSSSDMSIHSPYTPFSWSRTPNLETIVTLLESHFTPLLDPTALESYKLSNMHPYLGDKEYGVEELLTSKSSRAIVSEDLTEIVRINVGSHFVQFPHDIRPDHRTEDLITFYRKLERRVDRVYDRRYYRRLVRYESNPHRLTLTMVQRLLKFGEELILVSPKPEKINTDIIHHPSVKVIKDNGGHTSWRREKLGMLF